MKDYEGQPEPRVGRGSDGGLSTVEPPSTSAAAPSTVAKCSPFVSESASYPDQGTHSWHIATAKGGSWGYPTPITSKRASYTSAASADWNEAVRFSPLPLPCRLLQPVGDDAIDLPRYQAPSQLLAMRSRRKRTRTAVRRRPSPSKRSPSCTMSLACPADGQATSARAGALVSEGHVARARLSVECWRWSWHTGSRPVCCCLFFS